MRKALLIILLVLLGGGAGFGLAYLASRNVTARIVKEPVVVNPQTQPEQPYYNNPRGRNFNGFGMGPGMMGPYDDENSNTNGTRLTLDQAVEKVNAAVSSMGSDFTVAEVMEFQNNFYAAVLEKSTGRGAFELLVDPYTGNVSYEPGPDMMWNLKYGRMGRGSLVTQDNTVTLAEAKDLAQKALDAQGNGAAVESSGYDFYGYYTFDYQVNGKIAGMLSVNGLNGEVWFHTWHGTFIEEKELAQ